LLHWNLKLKQFEFSHHLVLFVDCRQQKLMSWQIHALVMLEYHLCLKIEGK
jgi:hypothetical protein